MARSYLLAQDGDNLLTQSGWLLLLQGDSVANTLNLWKGAVAPSESSASGNQIALWKGAVEPAAPSSAGGGSSVFARSLAQPLASNLARTITGN